MNIRYIEETDNLIDISHIYEESWKCAYKGMLPASFLESIENGRWVNSLKQEGRYSLVIEEDGKLVGTASYCLSRQETLPSYGELVAIYLLPEYIGKGYGKPLYEAVLQGLQSLGVDGIYLWVLEDNKGAIEFYEKLGYSFNGKYLEDEIGGKQVRELMMCREW